MKVSLTVSIVAVTLAAAPMVAIAAPPFVRPFAPPVVTHGAGPDWHAFWRHGDGGGDFGRRRRFDLGGLVGEAAAPGPEAAAAFVVSAPVFVNVTLVSAAGPQRGATDGPKLIEIGRNAPRRGPLPLVVTGD